MTMQPLGRDDQGRLRALLLAEHPWLDRTDLGPSAVDAGECAACGRQPNLVPTCGPGASVVALCAGCAVALGVDAWCSGHRDDAEDALAWIAGLPPEWPSVTRLWWVATGEIDLDPALLATTPAAAELVNRVADLA